MNRKTKGLLGGAALFAFGVFGAGWTYLQDSNSFDYFRMNNAVSLAELHALIFCGLGVAVMLWFWLTSGRDDGSPCE